MKKIISLSMILFLSLVSCKRITEDIPLVTLHFNGGKIDGDKSLVLTYEEFEKLDKTPSLEGHIFCSYYLDVYFDEHFDGNVDSNRSINLYARYVEDIFDYEIVNDEVVITEISKNLNIQDVVVPEYILNKPVTTLKSESISNIEINKLTLESIENIEIDAFKGSKISILKISDDIKKIEYGAFRDIKYLYNVVIEDNKYYSATNNVIMEKLEGKQRRIIGYYNEFWPSMFNELNLSLVEIVDIAPYSFSNIYSEEDIEAVKDKNGDILKDQDGNIVYKPTPEGFSLYVPSTLEKLGERAFENCSVNRFNENEETPIQLGVYFFSKLKEIGKYAFNNSSLTLVKYETIIENDIVLPANEGVKIFKEGAFQNTDFIKLTLPKTLETIEQDCFKGCDKLEVIYYEGTEEEFNNINIAEGNEVLKNAKIYYFSTIETENGWYYYDNNHESVPSPVTYESLLTN